MKVGLRLPGIFLITIALPLYQEDALEMRRGV
jgi:hypothetical protein